MLGVELVGSYLLTSTVYSLRVYVLRRRPQLGWESSLWELSSNVYRLSAVPLITGTAASLALPLPISHPPFPISGPVLTPKTPRVLCVGILREGGEGAR